MTTQMIVMMFCDDADANECDDLDDDDGRYGCHDCVLLNRLT